MYVIARWIFAFEIRSTLSEKNQLKSVVLLVLKYLNSGFTCFHGLSCCLGWPQVSSLVMGRDEQSAVNVLSASSLLIASCLRFEHPVVILRALLVFDKAFTFLLLHSRPAVN